jgi:hypothetical protein
MYGYSYVLLIPDVKFIASPPSMVAAGSLVASVKGLQMRIVGNAMTEQNLTENLAQIIRSDPVSEARNCWLVFLVNQSGPAYYLKT